MKQIHSDERLRHVKHVLHPEYGIGLYSGMVVVRNDGIESEYCVLTYAQNDKLYLPLASIYVLDPCKSDGNEVSLDSLRNNEWKKSREKIFERIKDTAAYLLKVNAHRQVKSGFSFARKKQQYKEFCEAFPFPLTSDQRRTIDSVVHDMRRSVIMDRIVCGDVGFGKTEIAVRAAFIAVQNDKQVAVLVPTTLLAQQHFDVFRDRFSPWPVSIAMVSRFQSKQKHRQSLEGISNGSVNVVIGTHKLLQSRVRWKDLGLLVIDEEHRFGVQQKERIRRHHQDVDTLTLTATPIPRTLNIAMEGMRDLSIIHTPPKKRLSIKTFLRKKSIRLIKTAVSYELNRGGQVYYLYNKVKSIGAVFDQLTRIFPKSRIGVGHGKMPAHHLQNVMNRFQRRQFDILLCTSILETGIDIGNANTIIIEHAHTFGLAQLHQLRGRVGRSHRQAYAYLLIPSEKSVGKHAAQRLTAVSSADKLGSGFSLSTHDLDIRGCGEILGNNQSGRIRSIGMPLYRKLLRNAIRLLKQGKAPTFDKCVNDSTEINLQMAAFLPKQYIANAELRLQWYQKIVHATDPRRLRTLESRLMERFGTLPKPAQCLFEIERLKRQARKIGISKIEGNNAWGSVEFRKDNNVDLPHLIQLVRRNPSGYRFDNFMRLKFSFHSTRRIKQLEQIKNLLRSVAEHARTTDTRIDG